MCMFRGWLLSIVLSFVYKLICVLLQWTQQSPKSSMIMTACFTVLAVGEPLNDEAWLWYHNVVGEGQCTVVDTWWQTGTTLFYSVCVCVFPCVLMCVYVCMHVCACVCTHHCSYMYMYVYIIIVNQNTCVIYLACILTPVYVWAYYAKNDLRIISTVYPNILNYIHVFITRKHVHDVNAYYTHCNINDVSMWFFRAESYFPKLHFQKSKCQ